MEVREQLAGFSFLLHDVGARLASGHQAWQQMLLLDKSPHWSTFIFQCLSESNFYLDKVQHINVLSLQLEQISRYIETLH